jgi:hypothetical protein
MHCILAGRCNLATREQTEKQQQTTRLAGWAFSAALSQMPKRPTKPQAHSWAVYHLKGTPAKLVEIVYASDEIAPDDVQEHLEAVNEAGQILRDWRAGRFAEPAGEGTAVPTMQAVQPAPPPGNQDPELRSVSNELV